MSCFLQRRLSLGITAAATVACAAWFAPTVHAQTIYFAQDNPRGLLTNSNAAYNSFTSALTSFYTNDLETVSGLNPTLSFGATGVTAATSGPTASIAVNGETGTNGYIIPVSGSKFFANTPESEMTFSLNKSVSAFGLYAIDAGTLGNSTPANLYFTLKNTATGASKTVLANPAGETGVTNNVIFFGVTDFTNPFDQITVGGGASVVLPQGTARDGISYDNITVGSARSNATTQIPEPSSIAFAIVAGIPLVSAIRSRRRFSK